MKKLTMGTRETKKEKKISKMWKIYFKKTKKIICQLNITFLFQVFLCGNISNIKWMWMN